MKISFTTLGCPNWNLDTICTLGKEYGFDGVDFRGYLDHLDVTQLPEFTTQVNTTRRKIEDAGLEISGISSSIRLCVKEENEHNMEEARRTIPVAKALNCHFVRVFGGGDPQKTSRLELAHIGRDTIEDILSLDGAEDIHWLFETHDAWIKSDDCLLLLDANPNPAFGALWDMGHTWRVTGEKPAETMAKIGNRVGYTHVKDAVYDPDHPLAMSDGWRYVFPGSGQLPLVESINLLKEHGFDGWLMFEHEKRWHPELPEPEEAFKAFADWARTII
jgi:sugar phosphate isomerase/epimerase